MGEYAVLFVGPLVGLVGFFVGWYFRGLAIYQAQKRETGRRAEGFVQLLQKREATEKIGRQFERLIRNTCPDERFAITSGLESNPYAYEIIVRRRPLLSGSGNWVFSLKVDLQLKEGWQISWKGSGLEIPSYSTDDASVKRALKDVAAYLNTVTSVATLNR